MKKVRIRRSYTTHIRQVHIRKSVYEKYISHIPSPYTNGSYMEEIFSSSVYTIRTVTSSRGRVSVLLTFKKVSVTENWDKSVPLTFFKSHWSWVSLWMHTDSKTKIFFNWAIVSFNLHCLTLHCYLYWYSWYFEIESGTYSFRAGGGVWSSVF